MKTRCVWLFLVLCLPISLFAVRIQFGASGDTSLGPVFTVTIDQATYFETQAFMLDGQPQRGRIQNGIYSSRANEKIPQYPEGLSMAYLLQEAHAQATAALPLLPAVPPNPPATTALLGSAASAAASFISSAGTLISETLPALWSSTSQSSSSSSSSSSTADIQQATDPVFSLTDLPPDARSDLNQVDKALENWLWQDLVRRRSTAPQTLLRISIDLGDMMLQQGVIRLMLTMLSQLESFDINGRRYFRWELRQEGFLSTIEGIKNGNLIYSDPQAAVEFLRNPTPSKETSERLTHQMVLRLIEIWLQNHNHFPAFTDEAVKALLHRIIHHEKDATAWQRYQASILLVRMLLAENLDAEQTAYYRELAENLLGLLRSNEADGWQSNEARIQLAEMQTSSYIDEEILPSEEVIQILEHVLDSHQTTPSQRHTACLQLMHILRLENLFRQKKWRTKAIRHLMGVLKEAPEATEERNKARLFLAELLMDITENEDLTEIKELIEIEKLRNGKREELMEIEKSWEMEIERLREIKVPSEIKIEKLSEIKELMDMKREKLKEIEKFKGIEELLERANKLLFDVLKPANEANCWQCNEARRLLTQSAEIPPLFSDSIIHIVEAIRHLGEILDPNSGAAPTQNEEHQGLIELMQLFQQKIGKSGE